MTVRVLTNIVLVLPSAGAELDLPGLETTIPVTIISKYPKPNKLK